MEKQEVLSERKLALKQDILEFKIKSKTNLC